MIILAIKTDQQQSQLVITNNSEILTDYSWLAGRSLSIEIHTKIKELLDQNNLTWSSIEGIIVYKGPGSFTGLRIGISVANAIAYSQNIPIVGTESDNWLNKGVEQLQKGTNQKVIIPFYGQEPNITAPRK